MAKKIFVLSLMLMVAVSGAYAQQKSTTGKTTTTSSKKKKARPYYQEQNFITLSGGIHFAQRPNSTFNHPRPISIPLYFNPELTLRDNLRVGLQVVHYKYMSYVQFNDGRRDINTLWLADSVKYNHIMAGATVAYHLNNIITSVTKWEVPAQFDFYGKGAIGYNFVTATDGAPKDDQAQTLRLGLVAGARYLYSNKIGFSLEMGLSSYGYGSFGVTYLLGEKF